jgi:hypothetical protein
MDKAPRTLNTLLPLDLDKRIEKSYKVEKRPVKLILKRDLEGPYTIQVIVTGRQKYTPLFSDRVISEKDLNNLWRLCLENIKTHR